MKIVVANNWDPEGLENVKADFPDIEWVNGKTPDERLAQIADAEVVYGHVDQKSFKAAKSLKWIHSHSAGVDWVRSIPDLVESDVVVTNTSGGHANTIAEHTIGMLIYLTRGFSHLARAQQDRRWAQPLEFNPIGLSGMTMGIVGLGRIGRKIAHVAHALDMNVIAVDANDVERPDFVTGFWQLDGLNELLQRSDVVVITVPGTPETVDMLGPEEFTLMKPSAYLLSISRGGIVNEPALMTALEQGKLAGAGLDVASREPLPSDDPLWDAPNLILTPHCCGTSSQTFSAVTEYLRTNLNLYLEGKPLVNVIDKRLGY